MVTEIEMMRETVIVREMYMEMEETEVAEARLRYSVKAI